MFLIILANLKVTSVTSKISSIGIGLTLFSIIDSEKAETHSYCPLSCPHNFLVLKPPQPYAFKTLKLSICKILLATNISTRSFENNLSPFVK